MADRVGVYEISADVMTSAGMAQAVIPEFYLTAALPDSVVSDPIASATITGSVIGVLWNEDSEFNRLNAYYSGTEQIDPNAESPVDKNLYYAKYRRLQYATTSYVITLADVLNNVPDVAPTGSAARKPNPGALAIPVSSTLARVGQVLSGAPPGQLYVEAWTNYVTGSAAGQAVLTGSALGNLIRVNGVYSTVSSASLPAPGNVLVYTLDTTGSGWAPASGNDVYLFSWIPLSSSVSGVFMNRTQYEPSTINLPISASGEVSDIRVWVEFVHDVRTLSSTGLQGVAIALRSPSTAFKAAHPMWNSTQVSSFPLTTDPTVLATTSSHGQKYVDVPSLLQNSYLLWAGHLTQDSVLNSINSAAVSSSYHEFDRDIDMRTVFWDGSPTTNPRDLSSLFPNATEDSPGATLGFNAFTGTLLGKYRSPTYGAVASALWPSLSMSVTGAGAPWMVDNRMPGPAGTLAASSVPPGWEGTFTAPGQNLGPTTIRPVYPLLDDVHVNRISVNPNNTNPYFRVGPDKTTYGYRPGLRHSQVSGSWQLLFGTAANTFDVALGFRSRQDAGIWLRQAKIELVYSQNRDAFSFTPSTARVYNRPARVASSEGLGRESIISGSCAWDVGVCYESNFVPADAGRTVSITDKNTTDNYAVLTFITGNLYTSLSAAGIVEPSWYLNGNGFGTPYIPDSSMSLGSASAETIDFAANQEIFKQTLDIRSGIPASNDGFAYLSRQGYTKSTIVRWEEAIASLTASTTGYFPGV